MFFPLLITPKLSYELTKCDPWHTLFGIRAKCTFLAWLYIVVVNETNKYELMCINDSNFNIWGVQKRQKENYTVYIFGIFCSQIRTSAGGGINNIGYCFEVWETELPYSRLRPNWTECWREYLPGCLHPSAINGYCSRTTTFGIQNHCLI